MKKIVIVILTLSLALLCIVPFATTNDETRLPEYNDTGSTIEPIRPAASMVIPESESSSSPQPQFSGTPTSATPSPQPVHTLETSPVFIAPVISLSDIPGYNGLPYVEVNGNQPFFSSDDLTLEVFEEYSQLDQLGRCGVAYANVCTELMPTGERENSSHIKPSGWHLVRYDDLISDRYLFNRCHLIGFQLCGESANERNMITGTRYLNIQGMLPHENRVADYVRSTDNHVLYRVTPIFERQSRLQRCPDGGIFSRGWRARAQFLCLRLQCSTFHRH